MPAWYTKEQHDKAWEALRVLGLALHTFKPLEKRPFLVRA